MFGVVVVNKMKIREIRVEAIGRGREKEGAFVSDIAR